MTSFAPTIASLAKKITDSDFKDGFFKVAPIKYSPSSKPDDLAFKWYNAEEVIMGKPMKEHLRFAVCYWHTFRGTGADPFGAPTLERPWEDGSDSLENAKRRMRAAFEFFTKLGATHWTFHDRDIAPEGKTLDETNANLDALVDLALQLQKETGVKLLWGTCNLFANARYANGAATNPDMHVFACAAAQVKKMLEVTSRLGGENFVFWGGREGYISLLNSDVKRELDHLAAFFKMAVAYAEKIGFKGQFLIEPKPKEPSGHQYDYDAQTVIGFLKTYGLDKHFKLNIEPNHGQLAGHRYVHDVHMAAKLGFLGSIDANTGSEDLGWDTDQFPMDTNNNTQMLLAVLQKGGIAPGGFNFDCKVRRESSDVEDLFWGHVGAMDSLALALRIAASILTDGTHAKWIAERYSTYDTGLGAKIESGQTNFEELEEFVKKHGMFPTKRSGKQEKFEVLLNRFLHPVGGSDAVTGGSEGPKKDKGVKRKASSE